MSSAVTHPSHYNSGSIEVIEAIEDWNLNFHRGNAVKYTARAGKKEPGKEIEDLEKAVWYLKREIEKLSALKEKRATARPNAMNPRPPSTSVTSVSSGSQPVNPVANAKTVTEPFHLFGEWIEKEGVIVFQPINLRVSELSSLLRQKGRVIFVRSE